MKLLTPRYALEVGEILTLRRRLEGQVLAELELTRSGAGMLFHNLPSPLDAEMLRLLVQWAFEREGVQDLSLPLAADLLALAPAVGARIEEGQWRVRAAAFAAANRTLGCKGASWLEQALPPVYVAAIALINDRNEVLLAQRPEGKPFAGLWEFPGGKIKGDESPELALCREVREELGIQIWNSCLSPLTFVSQAYADFHLTLLAFACYKFEGTPRGQEGQTLEWWPHKTLDGSLMPPASTHLVPVVQDLLG